MSPDRTLVQIRERSFLDLLDLSLMVVRTRPLALGIAAAAGIVPFEVLNAWILGETRDGGLWVPLMILEQPLASAPLTVVLGGLMFGQRPTAGRVVVTTLRGLFSLLFFQGFVRAILLGTFFLAPLIPAQLGFLNEVILLERCSWSRLVSRSSRLSRGRGVELVGRTMAAGVFTLMFVASFWWASGKLEGLLFHESTWQSSSEFEGYPGWRLRLGAWLALSFWGVVRFLTYIDQRIRLEGWEISLRLRAAGASLEEDGRW